MRKIILVLLALLLFGCSYNNPKEETIIEQVEENSSRIVPISVNELKQKEEECKYFVLFVYTPGHESCEEFKEIVEKYLERNGTQFFSIEYDELIKTDSVANNYIEGTPSVVIYSSDGVKDCLNASLKENYQYCLSSAGFEKWMADKTEEYCLKEKQDKNYCSIGC